MTSNARCRIDHLIIGAETLEQGVQFVKETLGVDVPPGGKHSAMATHNHVMSLGDDVYLEVIAADHSAAAQIERLHQPRWFALDDPYIKQRLSESPTLLTWAVNTPNIHQTLEAARWHGGDALRLSRGELSWSFAMPEDGRLHAAGVLPYIIQWHIDEHPSRQMQDNGVRLDGLCIEHPHAEWLSDCLRSVGADGLVTVESLQPHESPRLKARFSLGGDDSSQTVELCSGIRPA